MKVLFSVLLIFFALNISADAVPVVPNEVVVRGHVLEYCLTSSRPLEIKPETVLYKITISVEKAEDVKGPNFLKGKEGQTVIFYSREELSIALIGKKIKAKAEYRGDERGGIFWIKEIEIVK